MAGLFKKRAGGGKKEAALEQTKGMFQGGLETRKKTVGGENKKVIERSRGKEGKDAACCGLPVGRTVKE